MSLGLCKCGEGPGNTGLTKCNQLPAVTKKYLFVPLFDDDGNRNFLDPQTLTAIAMNDLINEDDSSKRYYPTLEVENVTSERADPIIVQDGVRTVESFMVEAPAEYLRKMQEWRCQNMGYYVIDKAGGVIGEVNPKAPDEFRPIPIQKGTFYAGLMTVQDGQFQMVRLLWNVADTFNDANLRVLTAEETDVEFLELKGLLDVNGDFSSTPLTTTTATVALTFDYGTAKQAQKAVGFVLADFTLDNLTTGLPVVITSVTETVPGESGVYDIVFPLQASTNELSFGLDKDGFDGANMARNVQTIP